jgi:hypothetical protein
LEFEFVARDWVVEAIAWVLLVGASVAGVLLVRRSPCAALALFGFVCAGIIGFNVSSAVQGRRDVPFDVAAYASIGLYVGGTFGLLWRGRGPASLLRALATAVLLLGLSAAAILAIVLVYACPPYITERAGYCYHNNDLLGGWITLVVALFVIDVLVLSGLLAIDAWRVRRAGPESAFG